MIPRMDLTQLFNVYLSEKIQHKEFFKSVAYSIHHVLRLKYLKFEK
ncbi:MAG: hypothetical protein H6Q19_551 [Bacteroidetes bacterium]|nr:hypothetical protein [Bacteroidota bacterium]